MKGNYEEGIAHIMGGEVDLVNAQISVALIDLTKYTPDLVNHDTLDEVTEDALIAERVLIGKTLDGTTFRADNPVFTNIPTGTPDVGAFLVFLETGDLNTSLLLYFDEDATNLPVTPDGTDITIPWDLGVNGIFKM